MRLQHFYTQFARIGKNALGTGFIRTFLLAGIVMVFMPFVSRADTPTPVYGGVQSHTVCNNMSTDVSEWLKVIDIDFGETLTWTIVGGGPSAGTLSNDGATAPAGGSGATPGGGMVYTPTDMSAAGDAFTVQITDDMANSTTITIILTFNAGPSLTLGSNPSVCSGVTTTSISFTDLTNVGPDTVIFNTSGTHSWTVPTNVTSVKFDVMGASGGNDTRSVTPLPGLGGRVQGTLSVPPGTLLNINVGGVGGDGTASGATGGFNGGGDAFNYFTTGCGGAGGGASDIRIGGTGLANRKIVAGGGGGSGADVSPVLTAFAGGHGGGLTGGNSATNPGGGATARGGTQTAGGAAATYSGWMPGGSGTSGDGGDGSVQGISGGGGGGFFGGGGGVWTGGGGGSSYTDNITVFSVTHTQGANTGDGVVNLYYVNPGTYDIIWDATALGEGFNNVANVEMPAGNEFPIAVPELATPGTYNGTITIRNYHSGGPSDYCNSVAYPFSIEIKPLPVVNNPGNIEVCHGGFTGDINFFGPLSGSSYNWVNDNPGIGVAASGTGHIGSFETINTTPLPAVATFTVTPVANGCIGVSEIFQIIDNPLPMLNSTTTPPSICDNTLFSYIPNSLTPGTSFNWSRASVFGITNPANSGTDNPNETLTNTTTDPIAVTYTYTLSANGCENIQDVVVIVNPTPQLTSPSNPAPLCNDGSFTYTPTSSTTAAALTWNRPVVSGISNAAASGSGVITETLLNTTATPKDVTYVITMTIDGCVYTQNVVVTVNPPLTLTSATSLGAMCDGSTLTYAPVSSVPSATKTWSRAAVAGISDAAATGTGIISEALHNTTPDPIVVTYVYTLSAFGCNNNINVTKTVNPRAKLSSPLIAEPICTNTLFSYTPTSATAGATFQWARDNTPGISNPATPVLTGSVSEVLVNFTDLPVNVKYLYTTTAYGCAHADTVWVTVNPLPRIVNDTTGLAVCDSALFSFTPVSATPGATYTWKRDYEAGIANLGNTGTGGNPNERLNNTTYISVPATYVYTITANGCSNTQSVIVQVRPSAILTHTTGVACSGAPFRFDPVSYTSLTTFAWVRTAIPGVTPPTSTGTGSIMDTLTHTSGSPVVVTYDYNLTVFGCANMQKVTVTVNPQPTPTPIAIHPSADLCTNAQNMNFGAATPPAEGYSYSWSATNATLIATGGTRQYAIVTFNTPGAAVVTLTTRINGTTCTSKATFDVNVGTVTVESPTVIYFDRQFICQQTQKTSYQWGYDDAATLDSIAIVGATNQNHLEEHPDFTNKKYWVVTTTAEGCTQKTYYNKPAGVADINSDVASMKIFPNPASSYINVEVSRVATGDIRMDVFNMLGQKLQSVPANGNSAQISVAEMPAGAYIVECYSDGVKVTAARFIKN